MYTSVTDNVLIIEGLLGYADDPLRVVSDVSLKARVLALLRLGGMTSPAFSEALEELLQSLLESPHAPAIQEILAHSPSQRDAVRSAESSDEDWIIEAEEADGLSARFERHLRAQTESLAVGYECVPIFFATDRAPTGKDEPRCYFSGRRGDLQFGYAEVSIPDRHRRGRLEQPPWFVPFVKHKPQRHVALLDVTCATQGAFADYLRAAAGQTSSQDVLLVIHGYNVSFEAAAQRTAQLAYDLQFTGLPILYSWPSTSRWYSYTVDEANVESTVSDFGIFMSLVRSALPTSTVHVIAHSMGNRLLRDFVEQNAGRIEKGAAKLGEIMMAAPDVDAKVFRRTNSAAWDSANHFTLYASSYDWALRLSKFVHGYDRAGDSGDRLIILDKVDAIDASHVQTGLFGHTYYGDSSSILVDMFLLLHHGFAPSQRPALEARRRSDGPYWEFKR